MATVAERQTMRVDELERDTWIKVVDEDGEGLGEARVLHVEAYDHGPFDHRRALLMFGRPGYDPESISVPADMAMRLMTDAEIDDVMEEERRERIAARFDRLAALFRETVTPLPDTWRGITVSVDFGADVDKVARVATALLLKVAEPGSGSMVSVLWNDDSCPTAGVTAHFYGHRPKEADPTDTADETGRA